MSQPSSTRPGFLLLLTATSALLVGLIVAPFAGALFAAAVFASVAHPTKVWLARRLGDREGLAAGVVTAVVLAVAVVPLAVLTIYAVEQIGEVYRQVDGTLRRDGLEGLVAELPESLRGVAHRAAQAVFAEPIAEGGDAAAAAKAGGVRFSGANLQAAAAIATRFLGTTAGLMFELGVAVLAFFFLLSQGSRLVQWVVSVLPLSREQSTKIVDEFRDVTRGVFVATVATAFVQAGLAAVGYVVAGVAYVPLLIVVTFCAALIPLVGGATIVVAVGVWRLLVGDVLYGSLLIGWGVVAVGLSDNFVKPYLARGALSLPGSVILFAMIGGVAVFGPMGVVAGPLILAFFLATLRLLKQEGVIGEAA